MVALINFSRDGNLPVAFSFQSRTISASNSGADFRDLGSRNGAVALSCVQICLGDNELFGCVFCCRGGQRRCTENCFHVLPKWAKELHKETLTLTPCSDLLVPLVFTTWWANCNWGHHGYRLVGFQPFSFFICYHLPHILTPSKLFIDEGGARYAGLFVACNLRRDGVSVANQTKQKICAIDASAGN